MRRVALVAFVVVGLLLPATALGQGLPPSVDGPPTNVTPTGDPPGGAGTGIGGDRPPQGTIPGGQDPAPAPAPKPPTLPNQPQGNPPRTTPPTVTPPSRRANGRVCVTRRRVRTCRTYRNRQLTKLCVTRNRVKTCRTYRNRRVIKTCVEQPGRRIRCRTPRRPRATDPGPRANSSALFDQNYQSQTIPGVGKLYLNGAANCSGTMLLRGIVLTAGHCVYDREVRGTGYFPLNAQSFVPGNTTNDGVNPASNYGRWFFANAFTTLGYTQGDLSEDWGIVVLNPDTSGYYAGDYTGTWPAWSAYR